MTAAEVGHGVVGPHIVAPPTVETTDATPSNSASKSTRAEPKARNPLSHLGEGGVVSGAFISQQLVMSEWRAGRETQL